jgi:hypothetical protein
VRLAAQSQNLRRKRLKAVPQRAVTPEAQRVVRVGFHDPTEPKTRTALAAPETKVVIAKKTTIRNVTHD